jgi:hypothetical protein
VRGRGLRTEPRLPEEQGASEDELLTAEDELVLRSVAWAKQALDRMGARPADGSEGVSGEAGVR